MELRVRCLAAAQSCQMFGFDSLYSIRRHWDGWVFFFSPHYRQLIIFLSNLIPYVPLRKPSMACLEPFVIFIILFALSSASEPPAAANHFYVRVAGSSNVHASLALRYSFSLRGCNSWGECLRGGYQLRSRPAAIPQTPCPFPHGANFKN